MAALTYNQLSVIDAISKNDMPRARKAAFAALVEDTSKKNEYERNRLKTALDPTMNPQLEDVPHELRGLIEVENPNESFISERYYLSPREYDLLCEISRMRTVCDSLAMLRIRRPNTTLLYGESGTGKTTFGRYVASLFDLPFYYVNFSRLIDSYMGKTSQNLAMVFDYVRTVPCVLMLDEIDTITMRRKGNGGGTAGEIGRITVTMMQEFDKLANNQIIIGATNRLEIIDEALIRRFSIVHEVSKPQDEYEAAQTIAHTFEGTGIAYDIAEIEAFCADNRHKPQAWYTGKAVEEIVREIARQTTLESPCIALETGTPLFHIEIPNMTSENEQGKLF